MKGSRSRLVMTFDWRSGSVAGALLPVLIVLSSFVLNACTALKVLTYNYLPTTVAIRQTSQSSNPNALLASVTVCSPGSTTCRVVDRVLVDTGTSGLRILREALPSGMKPEQVGGQDIGECAFTQLGMIWGSVALASVTMAGEPPVTVPIHVVDPSFGTSTKPSPCNQQLATSDTLGANGILGLAPSRFDSGYFFGCQNGSCSNINVPDQQTVQNPAYLLPQDNNGITVILPVIPAAGAKTSGHSVVFGIGTQVNNDPRFLASGVPISLVPNSGTQRFCTDYKGTAYNSSISTGAYATVFPDVSIRTCKTGIGIFGPDFFCPDAPIILSANIHGCTEGSAAQDTNFLVGNAKFLIDSGNAAFDDLAMKTTDQQFTWGLSFFFGNAVFIPYTSGPLGNAPIWGYAQLPGPFRMSPQMRQIMKALRRNRQP